MLVSADDVSSVACGMWPSRRATGEELTSTACATQHSIRAGRMVRRRRSSAGLGRLSRLRHRRSPFPAARILAHGRNQDRLRYDEVTDLTRSPHPPRLPLTVARAPCSLPSEARGSSGSVRRSGPVASDMVGGAADGDAIRGAPPAPRTKLRAPVRSYADRSLACPPPLTLSRHRL